MKVRLTKLQSSNTNLRTEVVEGDTLALPQVGERFQMLAPPLDPAATLRLVSTSPVAELTADGFKTLNSTYRLEPL